MSETVWERTKRLSGGAWEGTKRFSGTAYDKALKPSYDKALKPGFDKAWKALDVLGAPVNRLSNKVGAEAFWPTSLDKESDKAARILRSFCKDGFYAQIDDREANRLKEEVEARKLAGENEEKGQEIKPVGPQGKQRVLKKIPESVIKKAVGLAIFTTMRTGLWVSGAGGSGILVARNEQTGEWSPPSGILIHTAGLGFLVGVDIYDCVVVINSYKALEAFTKLRCTLGGEISAVAGPVGVGGVVDSEVHKRHAPLFTYLKSRGFYAGVQVDGTIIIERTDENEVFYGERIPVADIIAGRAKNPPKEKYQLLMNTIHAAQGDPVPEQDLPSANEQTPGDMEIAENNFGVPDIEDPDPYGAKALKEAGIEIKDAGTHESASAEAFEFKPSPSSPIYATFARQNAETSPRPRSGSWRNSVLSVDAATQT